MKTLAALVLATTAFAAVAATEAEPRVQYVDASEEEVAAAFAEAEASGLVVRCTAADTVSGCRE